MAAVPSAASAGTSCANADALPGAADEAVLRAATLCLINEQRAGSGLRQLTADSRLDASAAAYSSRMVREAFFDHVAPDGSTLEQRTRAVGYVTPASGWLVGENIGWATGAVASPAGMVAAWMASPGHRANILEGQYREIGIGIQFGVPMASSAAIAGTYTTHFGERPETVTKNADSTVDPTTDSSPAKTSRAKRRAKKVSRARRAKAVRRAKAARRSSTTQAYFVRG